MSIYDNRGFLIRILYLIVALCWYVVTLGGRLNGGKAVVLCYHGVCQGHRERFRRQMAGIWGRAADIDKVAQLKPPYGIAQPMICITFDDAFANLLGNALPILEHYQIPSVIFAIPGNLGQKPQWHMPAEYSDRQEMIMTAEELKGISSESTVIGSHTMNHPDLAGATPDRVRKELQESKNALEQLLHRPVTELALPHGSYTPDVLEIARQTGYQRIYSLDPVLFGRQKRGNTIGRFSMSPDVWPIEFHLTCAGAYSWLYLFRKCIKIFCKFFN